MSQIDDLVTELCPNGVPVRTLGELGTIMRGRRFVKADLVETGTPCIHYGEIYTRYGTWATEAFSYLKPELASRLRLAQPGDVIVVSAGETVEDIGKSVAWLGKEGVVIHDALYAFRSPLDPKYVAYFSQTDDFHNQIRRYISSSKVSAISTENLAKVRIPAPPLEIQTAIVKTLDTFSELEAELKAELQAELEARRRQYVFYRNHMLTFVERERERERVRWKRMSEVFSMQAGQHVSAFEIADEPSDRSPFPVYGGNGLRGYGSRLSHSGLSLLIGRQGALCGNVKRVSGDFYATEHAVVTSTKGEMDIDFAFHLLTTMDLNQYKSSGAQPGLAVGKIGTVEVPVPPLTEQRRIARLLDKFDALANDLSIGLPAEIKARRKQYEHYRDRLLAFPEAA